MSHVGPALDPNYVLTLEELANLAAEEGKPAETLANVVALIARRFGTEVCSAYLLEPDRANLVLAATVGLRSRLPTASAQPVCTEDCLLVRFSRQALRRDGRLQTASRLRYATRSGAIHTAAAGGWVQ